jgi:hypothetical protein
MVRNYFVSPGVTDKLLTKMNHKGVTALKNDREFKTRVSGSRTHCVLPDGTLVDNKTRLHLRGAMEISRQAEKRRHTKNPYVLPGTTEKPQRRYYVNEKIISGRVFSYVTAMKNPVLHVVTISFPPVVSDNQGYQYLNTWLTVCRESLHLRQYLWVAERQENGTVHFHVLVPQYFNIVKANRAMMVILSTQVRKGALKWHIKAAKRYNGVDLAKDRKTKEVTNFADPKKRRNLVAYITKYVSKGRKPKDETDSSGGFSHLAWHNSRGFSSMFTGVNLTELEARFLGIRTLLNFEKKFDGEFFTWLPWTANQPPAVFNGILRTVNQAIMYCDSGEIQQKLRYMASNQGAPGWNNRNPYRQYIERREAAEIKSPRIKMTDAEFLDLQEKNKLLPTLEEWKKQNSKTNE